MDMEQEEGVFVDITDEEGNNFRLEVAGEVEYDGQLYRVFLPTDMDEEDPDYGLIFLKATQEGGEELLDTVDDDELLETLYDLYMEDIFGDDEEDGDDE